MWTLLEAVSIKGILKHTLDGFVSELQENFLEQIPGVISWEMY